MVGSAGRKILVCGVQRDGDVLIGSIQGPALKPDDRIRLKLPLFVLGIVFSSSGRARRLFAQGWALRWRSVHDLSPVRTGHFHFQQLLAIRAF